jgi:hypothetical protein
MYVLAFELRHDYSAEAWRRLSTVARGLFDSCVPLYSAWLVGSRLSPGEIVQALLDAKAIHEEDGLVVLELSGKGYFRNMAAQESAKWLSEHLTP